MSLNTTVVTEVLSEKKHASNGIWSPPIPCNWT